MTIENSRRKSVKQIMAVDIGGTFTDVVAVDPESGGVIFAKAPTTPTSPDKGVLDAVAQAETALAEVEYFFHGTTVGLNSVLEHRGAKVGLITTKGFRDVLEIGRGTSPMYHAHFAKPAPLVPRRLRVEVGERVAPDGTVVEPLDEDAVRAAIGELRAADVSAIAVCFLHAYANPAHELRVGELVAAADPELDCTLSHVVSKEYREYERTSTAIVDAMIKPVMSRYVRQLQGSLTGDGFDGQLLITRADGGVMTVGEVPRRGVQTLMSGPASGAMGAVEIGRQIEADHLIAVDMGGTSFDAAIIIDGHPTRDSQLKVADVPLLMPAVEIATIGAGGGSIAWIDQGGGLNVGPQSAGAEPGPICFGKGGAEPTFTDAALVTGIIDPSVYLGGRMTLDVEAARAGIGQSIAGPLGLDVEAAAAGIVELTEAKMASLLHEVTVDRGTDPRRFTLLAYGGGGPLVAAALAGRLAMSRVVIPHSPATFSAWGMLTLDIVHDYARTALANLDSIEPTAVRDVYAELEAEGSNALDAEGIPAERQEVIRSVDMRYESDHPGALRRPRANRRSARSLRRPPRRTVRLSHRRSDRHCDLPGAQYRQAGGRSPSASVGKQRGLGGLGTDRLPDPDPPGEWR
jgi:N-methylhydantoinase A